MAEIMKSRCLACGVEKDRAVLETYPYPEDGLTDEPIDPLIEIDCQGPRSEDVVDWRVVTVCHACFHRLDVDMWISHRCWSALDPVTAFADLPKLKPKS